MLAVAIANLTGLAGTVTIVVASTESMDFNLAIEVQAKYGKQALATVTPSAVGIRSEVATLVNSATVRNQPVGLTASAKVGNQAVVGFTASAKVGNQAVVGFTASAKVGN